MRRRGGVLAAAVLLAVLTVPAQAAERDLVLSGVGTVSTSIELTRPAVLDLQRLVPDGKADWSGIAVRDAAGTSVGMAIQVHRWVDGAPAGRAPAPITTTLGGLKLGPGRYQLLLLASGAATVRIPATGQLVRSLRASGHVEGASVRLTDLRTAGLPVANRRTAITVSRRQLAVTVFHERATAHQLSVPQLCFAAPGAETCVDALGFTTVLASPGSAGDGYVQSFTALYGKAGSYDALVQDATVDLPRCLDSLLVVV